MTGNLIKKTVLSFYDIRKLFFIKLLIFILIVFFLDYGIATALQYYYF